MNQGKRKLLTIFLFLLLVLTYNSADIKLDDAEFTSKGMKEDTFDSLIQDFDEYSLGIRWVRDHPMNTECSPCISDIDRDGELEIVIGGMCLDKNGEILWENEENAVTDTIIADINADSSPEVIFGVSGGISCCDANGEILWLFEGNSKYTFPCKEIAVGDLNLDGYLEIITGTDNGYIICLDSNGTLVWEYDHEADNPPIVTYTLNNPLIVDIDSDGYLEIIYSQRDLICLNSNGELKWSTPVMAGHSIPIAMGNLDTNLSTSEIILMKNIALDKSLICLSSEGIVKWEYMLGSGVPQGYIVADLNNDSIDEIILVKPKSVTCLDNFGNLIWYKGVGLGSDLQNQPAITDLNGDNELEILVGFNKNTLNCLDKSGILLWNFALPQLISDDILCADIDNDGKVEIFLNTPTSIYCIEISGEITSGKNQYLCSGGDPSRTNNVDSDGDYLVDCMEGYFNCDKKQEDTDGDGLKDGFEVYLYNTDPTTNDTDNDSLPDMWEIYSKLDATRNNTFEDPDSDGLTNIEEFTYSTDPLSDDTDNDDLSDYDEVFIYSTDPSRSDTDEDNLNDGDEILLFGTDPLLPDSDGDGMEDGWETYFNLNPLSNDSYIDNDTDGLINLMEFEYLSDPFNYDTDNDIISDGEEVFLYQTNPILNDTDFDELIDGNEIFIYFTDPKNNDTDDDLMPDGWEVQYELNPLLTDSLEDPDSDELLNIDEFGNNTIPNDFDTDDDLMPDGWEVQYNMNPLANDALLDPDRDELQNVIEFNIGTNPRKRDTDDDTMHDGWEYNNNLDPLTDDSSADSDEDGLSNLREYQYNTDPNLSDTDNDTLIDGLEVHVYQTNPLDPDTDDDLMIDGWEVQYGLNPLFDDSSEDPDGDFIDNINEYLQGKNPQQWDNWLVLYSLYLIPAYLLIMIIGYYISLKSRLYILRKKYGFLCIKDMKIASTSGFTYGEEFYTAILAGFSTKEQWLSANKQGFIFEDEWIEAQQSGFISSDSKESTEKIGYDDFIEFRREKTETMEKYRSILHNLFQNLLELKESNNLTNKRKNQLKSKLKKDISEIEPLKTKLIKYSDAPTDDHNFDKLVISEIQRFDELFSEVNKLLKS